MLRLSSNGKDTSVSVTKVCGKNRTITSCEIHTDCCEGVLPLDGDIYLYAAPPFWYMQLDQTRLFRVPKGTMVKLKPGVIHGAPISTLCCYLTICLLNLFFVWKYSPQKPKYIQLFAKPVVASALMGVAAWAVYGLISKVLSGHSAYGANALATFCGILAGVVVYGVLVIALRILRAEDVKSLPKGEKIAKLLRLK